jgi:hypothetical protein
MYKVTVRTSFDTEEQADIFLEALDDLDCDNMFPHGAEVRKDRIEQGENNISATHRLEADSVRN